MAQQPEELAHMIGRDLFDANRAKIGVITGLGFSRKKFGTWWLSVETTGGKTLPVPAEPIRTSHDRLMLPWAKAYIESGPAIEHDRPLSKSAERLLAVQYGYGNRMPTGECLQGCGLCVAARRAAERRRARG